MKRIILSAILIASTFTAFSQSLGYTDLGVMFGQNQHYGTSRFNSMSGAFGALGADVSAVDINPAGGVVARKSKFSFTLGNRNTAIDANYYKNITNNEDDYFNISQAGAILAFNSLTSDDWNRFAFSFNYKMKNDFDEYLSAQGNSGKALFNEHPNDSSNPINQYNKAQEQRFSSTTEGQTSVFNLGFSAVHQNKLFVGASLNMHDIEFAQTTRLQETNKDKAGNTLKANNLQKSRVNATGVSLSAGFIYKAHQAFRFGLAYESPVWYQEVLEESNINVFDPNNKRYDDWLGYTEISATNITRDINNNEKNTRYSYSLKTPSRITTSSAFVFDKKGLISIDYTYKGYKNTKFSNGNFDSTNKSFQEIIRNTHGVNIGTEWRFDKMSLRGGYHYEQTPYKKSPNNENIKGFSLGLGYKFGNTTFDLAYKNTSYNSRYLVYDSPNIDPVNPIQLKNNTSRITGTITFNL